MHVAPRRLAEELRLVIVNPDLRKMLRVDCTVVEEIRKGYQLKGKVIRPAMVIVAKSKVSSNEGEKVEDAKYPP